MNLYWEGQEITETSISQEDFWQASDLVIELFESTSLLWTCFTGGEMLWYKFNIESYNFSFYHSRRRSEVIYVVIWFNNTLEPF